MGHKLERKLNLPPHSIISLILKCRLQEAIAMILKEAHERGVNISFHFSFDRRKTLGRAK